MGIEKYPDYFFAASLASPAWILPSFSDSISQYLLNLSPIRRWTSSPYISISPMKEKC